MSQTAPKGSAVPPGSSQAPEVLLVYQSPSDMGFPEAHLGLRGGPEEIAAAYSASYVGFADRPLAVLDGATPRAAAQHPVLRDRLVWVMKQHANRCDGNGGPALTWTSTRSLWNWVSGIGSSRRSAWVILCRIHGWTIRLRQRNGLWTTSLWIWNPASKPRSLTTR